MSRDEHITNPSIGIVSGWAKNNLRWFDEYSQDQLLSIGRIYKQLEQ